MQSGERSASSEPPSDASDSRSRNTRRLTPILEAVQEAGFPDIDSMIAAYYSSSFEKNSFPDMAQKASRSRRLSKLLVELHEISDSWPKWQSRMFREGIMECASESETSQCIRYWHGHVADSTPQGKSATTSWKARRKVSRRNQMARTRLHI